MFWNNDTLVERLRERLGILESISEDQGTWTAKTTSHLIELKTRLHKAEDEITNLASLLKIYDDRQAKAIKVDEDWRLMADEKMMGFLKKLSDLETFTMTAISQEQNKRITLGERIVKLEEIKQQQRFQAIEAELKQCDINWVDNSNLLNILLPGLLKNLDGATERALKEWYEKEKLKKSKAENLKTEYLSKISLQEFTPEEKADYLRAAEAAVRMKKEKDLESKLEKPKEIR